MLAPRWIFLGVFLVALAILGTAMASQYLGGLEPCILCLWQRYPWAIVIGMAGIGTALSRVPGVPAEVLLVLALAIAVTLLGGAGIAAYHVGVEQHWWQGPAVCQVTGAPLTADALLQQLRTRPIVRCDEVAWSFAGISMAGYNLLASLGLGLVMLRFAMALNRTRRNDPLRKKGGGTM